jgi:HSP20 family protein
MWAEACALIGRAERLHRQFFQPRRSRSTQPSWEPPADIFETDHDLWVMVALPGVDADRVAVQLGDGLLIVTGVRRMPVETRAARIHRLEIPFGHFERRVALPTAHLELGRHDVVNGCLVLKLHKRPKRSGPAR